MPNSLAVRAATASSLARVQEILDGFAARDASGEILTAVRHIPAREAQWATMPDWIHPNLAAAYQAKGVAKVYSHQAAATEDVREGRHNVADTLTPSGKPVCYN